MGTKSIRVTAPGDIKEAYGKKGGLESGFQTVLPFADVGTHEEGGEK